MKKRGRSSFPVSQFSYHGVRTRFGRGIVRNHRLRVRCQERRIDVWHGLTAAVHPGDSSENEARFGEPSRFVKGSGRKLLVDRKRFATILRGESPPQRFRLIVPIVPAEF